MGVTHTWAPEGLDSVGFWGLEKSSFAPWCSCGATKCIRITASSRSCDTLVHPACMCQRAAALFNAVVHSKPGPCTTVDCGLGICLLRALLQHDMAPRNLTPGLVCAHIPSASMSSSSTTTVAGTVCAWVPPALPADERPEYTGAPRRHASKALVSSACERPPPASSSLGESCKMATPPAIPSVAAAALCSPAAVGWHGAACVCWLLQLPPRPEMDGPGSGGGPISAGVLDCCPCSAADATARGCASMSKAAPAGLSCSAGLCAGAAACSGNAAQHCCSSSSSVVLSMAAPLHLHAPEQASGRSVTHMSCPGACATQEGSAHPRWGLQQRPILASPCRHHRQVIRSLPLCTGRLGKCQLPARRILPWLPHSQPGLHQRPLHGLRAAGLSSCRCRTLLLGCRGLQLQGGRQPAPPRGLLRRHWRIWCCGVVLQHQHTCAMGLLARGQAAQIDLDVLTVLRC